MGIRPMTRAEARAVLEARGFGDLVQRWVRQEAWEARRTALKEEVKTFTP